MKELPGQLIEDEFEDQFAPVGEDEAELRRDELIDRTKELVDQFGYQDTIWQYFKRWVGIDQIEQELIDRINDQIDNVDARDLRDMLADAENMMEMEKRRRGGT